MKIHPTEEEVNDVIGWCIDLEETGESKFPGMSYENGVKAALEWMTMDGMERPDTD